MIRFAASFAFVSLALFANSHSRADLLITYNMSANENADGTPLHLQQSGVISKNGIDATFTASQPSNSRFYWSGDQGFGIDAGSSEGDPRHYLFDAATPNEAMTLSFSTQVTFRQLVLGLFNEDDAATLSFGGDPVELIPNGGSTFVFNTSRVVPAGQIITLAYSGGGLGAGFSLDSFTIAIPEPSTTFLALVVGGSFGAFQLRRRWTFCSREGQCSVGD